MTSPSDVTIAVPEPAAGHTLPPGTRLRDYRIERVLGEGGFGVVYLALDEALERHVAIKEYLPSSMASRASASFTVVVKSAQHRETFEHGKRSFLNEAKLLARFDHPALVKVHQYWEEHGTAYMVMPYYQGPTLKRVLAERGRPCTEADVRPWLMPLLDTLAVLHAERCYHRDVAPDNVLITARGPLLLDFGAARRVIGDLTHELTAVLKPGFAPIEQYGDVPGMSQGPWTDIYALASVLYLALAGRRPLTSVERLMDDQQPPLARVAAGRGSPTFLGAVDAALALRPKDRPQSVEDFRRLLDADLAGLRAGGSPVAPASVPVPAAAPVPAAVVAPPAAAAPAPARPRPAPLVDLPETLPPRATPALAPDPSTAPAEGPRNRAPLWAAGAALAVLATGGAWLASTRDGGAGGPAPVTAASAAAPVVASAPALPVPTAVAAEPPASEPAPAPAPTPAAAPAPASTATSPPAVAAAASEPDSPPSRPATASRAAPPAPQRQAARPARPAPAAEEAPAPAVTAPAPRPARPAPAESESTKCSDILQKASLEPLSAEETAYLKRECRR